jgi:hypothetical protein
MQREEGEGGCMTTYHYEMFGRLIYGEALTYEELMSREQTLTTEWTAYLQNIGASHIDFRPLGDALSVQCAFDEQHARDFEDVADTAAHLAGQHTEGRLVFVNRDLDNMYCFFLVDGSCRGGRLDLPTPQGGLAKKPPKMRYAHAHDRAAHE